MPWNTLMTIGRCYTINATGDRGTLELGRADELRCNCVLSCQK